MPLPPPPFANKDKHGTLPLALSNYLESGFISVTVDRRPLPRAVGKVQLHGRVGGEGVALVLTRALNHHPLGRVRAFLGCSPPILLG